MCTMYMPCVPCVCHVYHMGHVYHLFLGLSESSCDTAVGVSPTTVVACATASKLIYIHICILVLVA